MQDHPHQHHKLATLNLLQLNRAALRQLKDVQAEAPTHYLHLLNLAAWGLENGAEGEWPFKDQAALQQQVDNLFAWKPQIAFRWLLSNPNGQDKTEQTANLLNEINLASTPKAAAAAVLNAIYSRQVADNPALQPSASE